MMPFDDALLIVCGHPRPCTRTEALLKVPQGYVASVSHDKAVRSEFSAIREGKCRDTYTRRVMTSPEVVN